MQLQRWGKAVAVSRWGRVRVFFKKDSNQDCSFFQDTPCFQFDTRNLGLRHTPLPLLRHVHVSKRGIVLRLK